QGTDRHERRPHRRRQVRGGPGHRRGSAVRPEAPRRAARPRRRRLRGPDPPPARSAGGHPAVTAELVFATRNTKKLVELRRILEPELPDVRVVGLDDVPPYPEPAETEPTFAGNALIKARAAAANTGRAALADDSGLCVDALNGMPGVLSARWSGPPKDDVRNYELL